MQEDLEEDYWFNNGAPKYIKPVMIPSVIPEKNGQLRPTYIAIQYEKDTYVPRDYIKEEDLKKIE